MTALQPNAFAAGLRKALDIVKDQEELRARVAANHPELAHEYRCANHYLANVLDALADQLLDAGGFLGDAPEDEDLTAYIIGSNGEVWASFDLLGNDPLNPDVYAKLHADAIGCELDTSGLIPDGCEDFSVKISNAPDDLRCWTSCNYAIKGV